ncbi:MAG TPA: STAS domain-containing protein [Solirubrobacteraceae bacterium]|nr:STAS domain-containing protein [Solirubrobacteraceae bacterium]
MVDPRTRVITLSGEVDIVEARQLSAVFSEAVGDTTREVIVDLRDVTFMDSTGLGTILKAHARLRRQGRPMAVVVAPGPVMDLMAMGGLLEQLRVVDSLDGARDAVLA